MSDVVIEEAFELINVNMDLINVKSNKLDTINSHIGMSNLISNLSKVLKRYKKYSGIGWFGRIFTNDTIINANLVLCQYEFKSTMIKGVVLKKNIDADITALKQMIDECGEIGVKFKETYDRLELMLNDSSIGEYQKNRVSRKMNDILSAIILVENNIAQISLIMNNIYAINDKYESIDSILRPALERNIKLSGNDSNLLIGKLLK